MKVITGNAAATVLAPGDQDDKKARGRPREFDREAALAAALELFCAKGYAAVSVLELCAAMGISPPSLYAAYGNKAALFIEAARYYERMFWDAPGRRLFAEPDLHKAIGAYFQDACSLMLGAGQPRGRMTAFSAVSPSDAEPEVIAELARIRNATTAMFADRMRIAIQAGQLPEDADVPALAGCLAALLDGLALQARSGLFLSQLKAMAALAPRLLPAPAIAGAVTPLRGESARRVARAMLAPF